MIKKSYKLALHIFRRDLRLDDNTALMEALQSAEQVIPCFIFDTRQIENNSYKSLNCVQFMGHSLLELSAMLQKQKAKLYFFYGIAEEVIAQLLSTHPIEAVFVNRDYTPFSIQRDREIAKVCNSKRVDFHSYADALLNEPEQIAKADGHPYTIFTPFFRKSAQIPIAKPRLNKFTNYATPHVSLDNKTYLTTLLQDTNPRLAVRGGREGGLALLKTVSQLKNYDEMRNFPALNGTTKLSAHNKFGTISIREFYATITRAFGLSHSLLSELYWRDFFTHITFHYPQVIGHAFHKKYAAIKWDNNKRYFEAWCQGKTGFPIVDAGMRELNETGYMHNRVRMITASFLVKDLHINWRWGEKYFAIKLIDYDPAVNNGNWQWAASTGCDAQPYFRIFNPWRQQEKFDADCVYIKHWLPELASLPAKAIHHWYSSDQNITNYPKPIVDHSKESAKAKEQYASV